MNGIENRRTQKWKKSLLLSVSANRDKTEPAKQRPESSSLSTLETGEKKSRKDHLKTAKRVVEVIHKRTTKEIRNHSRSLTG